MSFPPTIVVDAPAFTMARVRAYGALTADLNPIHVDAEAAAASRFGRPIVHGLFVLAPVWEAIERALGDGALLAAESDMRFVAPTTVGTTPRYHVTLAGMVDGGARYTIEVTDADGTITVTGSVTVMA